jgi:hypothetical protein
MAEVKYGGREGRRTNQAERSDEERDARYEYIEAMTRSRRGVRTYFKHIPNLLFLPVSTIFSNTPKPPSESLCAFSSAAPAPARR